MNVIKAWKPSNWKLKRADQQPNYKDPEKLANCMKQIRSFPPLVFVGEIEALKKQLGQAAVGEKFILQAGDCAESFQDCKQKTIESKIKTLLQMSLILSRETHQPVIKIGRIAGQYGKPRSEEFEYVNGVKLPVYRGDNVNSFTPDPKLREADPQRLVSGYQHSALSLNYIRALSKGGFADLSQTKPWELENLSSATREKLAHVLKTFGDSLSYMNAFDFPHSRQPQVDIYTSHEGLILPYEEALTKQLPSGKYYNLGAHMLWLGVRTNSLDGAHLEYLKGIENPIGIKVGPHCKAENLAQIVRILNPKREQGKIVLITRFGQSNVKRLLPKFVKAIRLADAPVCWSCDPMHGNTYKTDSGIKTREFKSIVSELTETLNCHKSMGGHLSGVHFELTGENVSECLGGSNGPNMEDLSKHYKSLCDPRLNYNQSLELAFTLSAMLENQSPSQLLSASTSLQISPLRSSMRRSSPS